MEPLHKTRRIFSEMAFLLSLGLLFLGASYAHDYWGLYGVAAVVTAYYLLLTFVVKAWQSSKCKEDHAEFVAAANDKQISSIILIRKFRYFTAEHRHSWRRYLYSDLLLIEKKLLAEKRFRLGSGS